jgi:hypothetical protein
MRSLHDSVGFGARMVCFSMDSRRTTMDIGDSRILKRRYASSSVNDAGLEVDLDGRLKSEVDIKQPSAFRPKRFGP